MFRLFGCAYREMVIIVFESFVRIYIQGIYPATSPSSALDSRTGFYILYPA